MKRALAVLFSCYFGLSGCGGSTGVLPAPDGAVGSRASVKDLAYVRQFAASLQPEARLPFRTPVLDGWKIETATGTFFVPSPVKMRLAGKYAIGVYQFRAGGTLISVNTRDVRSIATVRSGKSRVLTPLSRFDDARNELAKTRRALHWETTVCNQPVGRDPWDDEWNWICICPDGSFAGLGQACTIWVDDFPVDPGYSYCTSDALDCLYGYLGDLNLNVPGSNRISLRDYLLCRLLGSLNPYHTVIEKDADGTFNCMTDHSNSNGELPLYYPFGGCPQYTTIVQRGAGRLVASNDYNHVYQRDFTWEEDMGGCNIHTGSFI